MSGSGPKRPFPYILTDTFADYSDKQLSFKFDELANTLAAIALNKRNRTPLVVVVRGGWGRGKTTLLRRTETVLLGQLKRKRQPRDQRRVQPVWFNAWKYPSDETIMAGLLGAMLEKMAGSSLREHLKALAIKELPGRLRTALWSVAQLLVPDLFADLVEDQKEFAGRFKPITEKAALFDAFYPLFGTICLAWADPALLSGTTFSPRDWRERLEKGQKNACLVIFLDDLDRCRLSRISEVLEALNLFFDMPGVCFYLGVDWDRLNLAIAKLYDDPRTQAQFLEKFVQISFELPTVDEHGLREFLKSVLPDDDPVSGLLRQPLVPGTGSEAQPITDPLLTIARLLDPRHPRHGKRLLNDLSIRMAVLRDCGMLQGTTPPAGATAEEQLPEAAVVAWHLLHEAETQDELRDAKGGVQILAQKLDSWSKKYGTPKFPENAGGERPNSDLAALVAIVAQLSPSQLKTLIHLGSPPAPIDLRIGGDVTTGLFQLGQLDGWSWIRVPNGRFRMGALADDEQADSDERPAHDVVITDDFWISRYPVTNLEYFEFVNETGARRPAHWVERRPPDGLARHPVVNVDWSEASEFANWLMRKHGKSGERSRLVQLPTEAQWEFAARGPGAAPRKYPWGDAEPTKEHANFDGQYGGTTPVGLLAAGNTPDGVADMAGNVWEWCRDGKRKYEASSSDILDPVGPDGGVRVLRGGSWFNLASFLRGSYRNLSPPVDRRNFVGFRLVWSFAGGRGDVGP